jgi:SAM-dependent methyltransferase
MCRQNAATERLGRCAAGALFLILMNGQFSPLLAQTKPLRAPDVRYEPSSPEVVREVLRLAGVGKRDVVYDLGCGDGRIVIAAAKEYGARGVGIDIDPHRIEESIANAREAGVEKRTRFMTEDLFETDIREATVVTLYLWPWINMKLRPKLMKELRPGTRVVSHYHDMGDWVPDRIVEVEGIKIYLWTIPPRAAAESKSK